MSFDTSIVIVTLLAERKAIEYVNRELDMEPRNRGQHLVECAGLGGGFNVLGWEVYGAGFDYIDTGSLVRALKSAPWRSPPTVTVHYISDHGDNAIWNAEHGTLHYDPLRDASFVSCDPFAGSQ